MLDQALPVLGTLIGALIAGITTYAAGARRAKTDLEIAERQTKTQVETARQQVESQLEAARQQARVTVEAETEKHRREKLEEAYRHLMTWIDDVEQTVNDVWGGLFAKDPETQARTKHVLDQWPWETLRPAKEAAATQHYWSKEIRDLRRSFSGASAAFHSAAGVALKTAPNKYSDRDETVRKFISDTFDGWTKLIGILEDIRTQAHADVLGQRRPGQADPAEPDFSD